MSIFEPATGRLPGTSGESQPQQLWPADVDRMYLDNHPRLYASEAQALLLQRPGSSFWLPETSEFILVTPWRHRQELATVHTFGAFGNEDALLRAAMDHARDEGCAGFVVVDINEIRNPAFYARHGLKQLEDIVTYEHRHPSKFAPAEVPEGIEFRRVDRSDRGLLDAVLELDHAAFSWFWWNSPEEFEFYLDYPGVDIWAGVRNHEVVAYAGTTIYRQWGHLDRIATHPDLQGTGLGRAILAFAMKELVRRGGRRVALSTQGNNDRSRSLYQNTGFARTPADDYSIFVAPFNESLIYAGMRR